MTPPPLLETTLDFRFKFDTMQKVLTVSRLDARGASLPHRLFFAIQWRQNKWWGKKEVVG